MSELPQPHKSEEDCSSVMDDDLRRPDARAHVGGRRALIWPSLAVVCLVLVVGVSWWLSRRTPDDVRVGGAIERPQEVLSGIRPMHWDISNRGLRTEGVRWAMRVAGYSSQFSDQTNAAIRILGAPDVLPEYGDDAYAWASRGQDVGFQWIEVAFAAEGRARSVLVVETAGAGALNRVDDVSDPAHPVVLWEGELPRIFQSRVLSFDLPVPRSIERLRLVLDTGRVPGWNEIDAVGLLPE